MTARPSKARAAMHPRPTISDLITDHRSMLSADNLPLNYGAIETVQDAMEIAFKPNPANRVLRMTIVWDNPASNLDLERALEYMRETGAAMVVTVEEVS